MTWRSLLIGLVLALLIATIGWWNDLALQAAYFCGDMVPSIAFGILILGLLVCNPALRMLRLRPLSGAEWGVMLAVMLMGCIVESPAMLWTFNNALVMPIQEYHNKAAWQEQKLMDYCPPRMLVDAGPPTDLQQYDTVVKGFANGLRSGKDQWIGIGKVPWANWTPTLAFWLPLMGMFFAATVCVVLVVHRQWAHRERLRYPIAEFASELMAGADKGFASIFHNKRFWIGFGVAFGILMINGLYTWGSSSQLNWHWVIQIPMEVDLRAVVGKKWPNPAPHWGMAMIHPYFVAVALAYFASSDVSFTLGISNFIQWFLYVALFTAGVNMTTDYMSGGLFAYQYFGSYLGMGIMIVYIGRRFYAGVLRSALGFPGRDPIERSAVWACRLALALAAGMVLLLVTVTGLNWVLATLAVMLTGLLFLVVTRINVETGMFSIQPTWHAVTILMGLFGVAALGPKMLLILGLFAAAITADPKVSAMPLIANALRFTDREGVSPAKLSPVLVLVLLAAMVVGVLATLYFQYNCGGSSSASSWYDAPGKNAFEVVSRNFSNFEGDAAAQAGVQWGLIQANHKFLGWAALGLVLVIGCTLLRLRYQWWPIHPVLFLTWGTFPMMAYGWSFLFGWVIKTAITKFGGGDAYRKNKALFIGMAAGEFAAGIIWAIIGYIYYFHNAMVPGPSFRTRM